MKNPFAENVKGTVVVDRRVYRDILKENLALMNKLDKAKEALRFYADADCYTDFGSAGLSEIDEDGGEWAQKVLEGIEE